uniref:NADH dehydrogenase subunit 5 n=1 Tax=Manayunkia occidentalis TaxID=2704156 RepID=UPI00165FC218|nr:NADH dehydrogenase subunit 5 [Manayunkia occidentalis]QLM00886.1 NADH dehydrogenase subunit 5 [Manayunkia occidentalis]
MSSTILWILSMLTMLFSLVVLIFNNMFLIEWEFLPILNIQIWFYILLDPTGLFLSSIVLFISANVIHFASFYMSDEPFLKRFIILILLFVLSMNLLIYIPHFMMLLLGWDGLGITSFILVIYYQSPSSLGAGMITALTNRIGDVLILVSIGLCLNHSHWNIILMWENNYSFVIMMLITIAAMTKSAQIPFSSWLPAAMAAPTPVSALVHSSTLVTAGVFLLIRFYPFLTQFKFFHLFLLMMATLTMIMAGMAALMESDLKKIIALSTLSQLGVMMTSIGLGLPTLALFHLMTHALFKALLFVCAGSIIHLNNHSQDLRLVGNLSLKMPFIMSCMISSNLALCGFPFMAGFYSKDLILEMSLFYNFNLLVVFFLILGTLLTAAYSIRFLFLVWFFHNNHLPLHVLKDSKPDSLIPSLSLTLGAIMGGSAMNWMFLTPVSEPFLLPTIKILPLMMSIMGGVIMALTITSTFMKLTNKFSLNYFTSMWFLTPLSTQYMIFSPLKTSLLLFKNIDQGWNELLGAQGIYKSLTSHSLFSILPQMSSPTAYMSISLVFISTLFFFM